ncbi:MAG: transmembrane domain-containing protein [Proteobacteria bacterium]|nr:transmembrane domain-containing protein [Pseudomonadota bacterium]
MIKPVHSLVVAVTAAAVYLSCSPSAAVAAQVKATRWSDPASWPGNKIPSAGDTVEIASDKQVILDVSPPALNGITINGTLSFANTVDLELTTEWIMLHGELQIGTQAKPHTRKATITLTDKIKGENLMGGMGDRGILLSGGTLNLHGNQKNTWTKLTRTAAAGSTSIQVGNASGWRVGDEIVLASTDYDPRQAEQRSITAIKGNTITLDRKLDYMHFGKITFGVDERGEVGLLTRNIKIQASEDAAQSFFGGHIMAMPTSKMFVEGIELTRMGQNLTLARYPIHWHLVGDALGQYIKNAAIHHTYNRCVTVHGTHNLRVENNVTYNTVGHCFFMEDGIEHGNEFIRNLAMQTKCHTSQPCVPTNLAAAGESAGFDDRQGVRASGQTSKQVLLPSDNTVSSFWITNPDNTYRDNVAAGSDANGFWMSLPEHPNGAFLGTDASKATWPRRTALREFKGNVAHSNYDGFMLDRNIAANNTFGVTGSSHQPKLDPADATSKTVESVFADLTAYKNRNGGIWGRGEMHTFINLKLADNAMGYTHASGNFGRDPFTSRVIDSLFVGESENLGNPQTPAEVAYGRSLPKPQLPDFPIRGYEYYDYRHDVQNSTFVNYQDNATRKTGAISYLLFTSFGVSTENAVEGAKFINAKPVYFPTLERKWGNDNGSSAAWKVSAIHDKDGSVSGVPNSYILINDGAYDSIAADAQACQIKPDWNAAVCKGDVGRMNFARAAGGPIAGIGAGAAGTPPPPPPQIVLSRNGKTYTVTQSSNVRSGTEIKLATAEPSLNVNLTELDKGSWVILELPGYTSATSGTALGSLDALRSASATSFYKDKDALWVKVVSDGSGASVAIPGSGTSIQVSR